MMPLIQDFCITQMLCTVMYPTGVCFLFATSETIQLYFFSSFIYFAIWVFLSFCHFNGFLFLLLHSCVDLWFLCYVIYVYDSNCIICYPLPKFGERFVFYKYVQSTINLSFLFSLNLFKWRQIWIYPKDIYLCIYVCIYIFLFIVNNTVIHPQSQIIN